MPAVLTLRLPPPVYAYCPRAVLRRHGYQLDKDGVLLLEMAPVLTSSNAVSGAFKFESVFTLTALFYKQYADFRLVQ